MFCINCGVKLSDNEKSCPLCGTLVCHPEFPAKDGHPLYPKGRKPQMQANSKVFNVMFIIIFVLPMLICFLSDLLNDGKADWFGFVVGGLLVGYIIFALPLWFRKPHPAIFVPCDFAACALFLLYIDLATGGNWFLGFAFPVTAVLGVIISAFAILLYCLKRARLYIWGGTLIALGCFTLFLEFMLGAAFGVGFSGWSLYPLVALALVGGLLIYLAANNTARETLERKLFF